MAGFGAQPFGTSSAGFGVPSRGTETGGAILRDEQTSRSYGGRFLDPKTGDYEMDENGRLLGMPNVQQCVTIAVLNAREDLARIDRLNDGFVKAANAVLSSRLEPLVREGLIEIRGVTSSRLGVRGGLRQGQAAYVFEWVDRTTNEERETEV